jgi:transcriptional regulator with XRE-family HTH domain
MLREHIIKARKEQGYTQCSLASKIGVRQATISEFESGKHALRSDILEKILQILEINTE